MSMKTGFEIVRSISTQWTRAQSAVSLWGTGTFARSKSAFAGRGTKLVEISEEFRRAKRNLAWAATAALVVAFITPTMTDASGNSVADRCGDIALSFFAEASLPVAMPATFMVIYLLYLAYGFWYESRRDVLQNSKAARARDPAAGAQKPDEVPVHEQLILKFREEADKATSSLHEAGQLLTSIPADSEKTVAIRQQAKSNLAQTVNEMVSQQKVLGDIASRLPVFNQFHDLGQEASDLGQTVEGIKGELMVIPSILGSAAQMIEKSVAAIPSYRIPTQEELDELARMVHALESQLQSTREAVTLAAQQYTSFSEQLERSDLRDHFLLERALPPLFALSAMASLTFRKGPCMINWMASPFL